MAYKMYMDDVLLPAAPASVSMRIKGQNQTLTLIDGSEINVLKSPGLTEVSFDLLLPQNPYPFLEGGAQSPEDYLSLFEEMKTSKSSFQWILSRSRPGGQALFYTNLTMALEEYEIKDDAKEGTDITVSVKLKQWRSYGTKTSKVSKTSTKAEPPKAKRAPGKNEPKAESYTVKSGDSLWNIAKKYYGDGSKWQKIYDANKSKIKSPSLIYPGQVFTIPR